MAARARRLADLLRAGGRNEKWSVELAATVPGDGARPATAAAIAAGCEVIVGCGGDGTLNEIADTVAAAGAAVALAAVPWGTANIYAQALGCPASVKRAAAWLLRAQPRPAPLGEADFLSGKRHFLAVASVGLDADVVHRLPIACKRRWGKLAYAGSALQGWWRRFPPPFQFASDGDSSSAIGVIVGLTRYYGGRLRLGRAGEHGIALALRGGRGMLFAQALWLATLGLEHAPGVERLPPRPIDVVTPGRAVQLDGEPAGFTPVRLSVRPAGLRVLGRYGSMALW